jgi:putative iron-dependent peroxidase
MPPVQSQPVSSGLTRAAMFLVVLVNEGEGNRDAILDFCADLSSFVRAVGFRDTSAELSCIMGFGSTAWDRLFGAPRPKELHPFREIQGAHHAVSTPGDILFHIRASRMDMCFELAQQMLGRLGASVTIVDEVHGFKYFDDRDLLGFVDGTENPQGGDAPAATIIGDEDPTFAGGSYVIVQKYLHDLPKWNALQVEVQEKIIGRAKLSDIEQKDSEKASYAHNVLTNIVDENGVQQQILRGNMPFGDIKSGVFGTYFIGYCKTPATTEKMLENMFIGVPPGNYDRLLDVSRAVTGTLFFVPSATFVNDIGPDGPSSQIEPGAASPGSTAVPVPESPPRPTPEK